LKFTKLEVKGVANTDTSDAYEIVEDDADAEFFSIYGQDDKGFAHCIGDFSTREGAEFIKAALDG
jgi:hypothetical protein